MNIYYYGILISLDSFQRNKKSRYTRFENAELKPVRFSANSKLGFANYQNANNAKPIYTYKKVNNSVDNKYVKMKRLGLLLLLIWRTRFSANNNASSTYHIKEQNIFESGQTHKSNIKKHNNTTRYYKEYRVINNQHIHSNNIIRKRNF